METDAQKTVLLRITEDKSSAARVQQTIERTRANIRQMAEEAKRLPLEIDKTSSRIRQMAEEAKRLPLPIVEQQVKRTFDPVKVKAFNDELAALRRELGGVGEDADTSGKKVSAMLDAYRQAKAGAGVTGNELPTDILGGGTAGRSRLSRLGADLKALPAVQIPGLGISTDAVGKLTQVFGALNPTALAAGAAIGGATLALKAFTDQANAAREAALADIAARQRALVLLQSGTQEEIKARIEQLREEKRLREQAAADARNTVGQLIIGIFEQSGDVGLALAEFNAALGTGAGELKAAREALDEAQKALSTTNVDLNLLEQGLAAGAGAAKAAEEAERKLAETRNRNAMANIDRLIAVQQEVRQLEATGTSENLQARLDSLAIERKAILDNLAAAQQLAEVSGDTSQVDRLRSRLNDIDTLVMSIQTAGVSDIIAAREREAQAAKDAEKAADDLAKAFDRIQDAQRKLASIQDAYNSKLADIADKLNKALTDKLAAIDKAIADAQDARADLLAKANDQLSENERAYFIDREKLAREHERRIQKIVRDGARNQQIAIEDRDAVALSRAQQQQQDALADENTAYDDRLREMDTRLSEQNRLVSKRLREQLIEVDKRLREQTQAAIVRYNEQVQVSNQQTQAARTAYLKQLADLKYNLAQDASIRNSGYLSMLNSAKTFATGLTAIGARLVNQLADMQRAASGQSTSRGGSKTPTPFAFGGLYRANTLAKVNDRYPGQRESFRGIPFPPGEGLFMSSHSGQIDAGRAGKSLTIAPGAIVVNGSSLNAVQVARLIRTELQSFVDAY